MPEGGAGAAGLIGAEIWALVAQHLEVREWARVAGTCRATWDVQLGSINVHEWIPLEGREHHMPAMRDAWWGIISPQPLPSRDLLRLGIVGGIVMI